MAAASARLIGPMVLTGLLMVATEAHAWWFGKQEPKESQPTAAARPTPAESARDKAAKEWITTLDGTQWTLTLRQPGSSEVTHDTVTFDGRRMTSEQLLKAGYADSNYTLTVQDGGTAVWETMQTKAGEGTALWRGEIQDERMSGILIKRPLEGAPVDFSFAASKIVPETPPESPPQTNPSESPHR